MYCWSGMLIRYYEYVPSHEMDSAHDKLIVGHIGFSFSEC